MDFVLGGRTGWTVLPVWRIVLCMRIVCFVVPCGCTAGWVSCLAIWLESWFIMYGLGMTGHGSVPCAAADGSSRCCVSFVWTRGGGGGIIETGGLVDVFIRDQGAWF